MKQLFTALLAALVLTQLFAQNNIKNSEVGFIENQGQILDQFGKPNADVKYLLGSNGMNVQLKKAGFSYDTYITHRKSLDNKPKQQRTQNDNSPELSETKIHRVDISLIGANPEAIILAEDPYADYLNYYLNDIALDKVRHFKRILYKDVYEGIDLSFYFQNGQFEYDFIVAPGADVTQIKLKYEGQNSLSFDGGNSISIHVDHGEFLEEIPHSFLRENNEELSVHYLQRSDGIFGFEVPLYASSKTLVIDPKPQIVWATYYGGFGTADQGTSVVADGSMVYLAGHTSTASNIATAGAFKTTIDDQDSFLAKFNTSTGQRIWATYYGGDNSQETNELIKLDNAGNIILCGYTYSPTGIATAGTHQTSIGGPQDVYLAKFNSSGSRVWGTYYGGSDYELPEGLDIDTNNNIIITGNTQSNNGIASSGAFQSVKINYRDMFLAKFSPAGLLEWGTYFGAETGQGVAVDAANNIYTVAKTTNEGLATFGAYKTAYSGGVLGEILLAKFDQTGNRIWSTYFGGEGTDAFDIEIDVLNNNELVFCGWNYYSALAAFAYRLSNDGKKSIWQKQLSSHHGIAYGLDLDNIGNAYVTGYVDVNSTGLASEDAYQTTFGGGTNDGFLAKITSNGSVIWSTYYGGEMNEQLLDLDITPDHKIYVAGYTNSYSQISSGAVSHQPLLGGSTGVDTNADAFLAVFDASYTPAATPTDQPGAILFASITSTSLTISYTAATSGPDGYLILRKSGSAITSVPTDGVPYNLGDLLNDGAEIIYLSTTTSLNQTGLSPNTSYYYAIFSYNGMGEQVNYLITSPASNNVITLAGPPTITNISPSSGAVATEVIITGTNFSTTATNNIVKLNGTTAAITGTPTATTIVTNVPTGATSGKITVEVGDQVATSTNDYTVTEAIVPTIASFNPISGSTGSSVTITGTKFSTTAANNVVKFNGTVALITGTPSATSIVTTVPAGTLTGPGKITVEVGGQTATSSSDFTVIIPSTTIQIVSESFLSTYDKGTNLTLSITVNNASNVSAVNFKSRGISEAPSAMKSVAVTAVGNKFEKVIASADLGDPIGVVYSFEVIDQTQGVVNSTSGKSYVKYDQVLTGLNFGSLVSNYQIIAVPVKLTDNTVAKAFTSLMPYDKTKWRLFDYANNDNREYSAFSTIEAGKGYWLIVKDSETINLGEGTSVKADDEAPFEINLSIGWNLIGNPYNFRVSWTDVLEANANPAGVDTKLKVFTGGTLTDGTTLEKYRGAFVHSNRAVPMKIPVTRNTSIGRLNEATDVLESLDQDHWEVKLTLNSGSLRNELGGIGMHPLATIKGKDKFDGVSVPLPEGLGLFELAYPHPEVFTDFNKEVVSTQENFTWSFDVKRSSDTGDLELTWVNDYFGENEKQLMLFDPATLQIVDMRLTNHFSISERTKKLQVLFGGSDYIQQALDDELPSLGNAYPNPATEELNIPFRIPQNIDLMPVQIKIYNGQGAEVATPVNQTLGKGSYEIKWQTEGKPGLYIVRMKIGMQETKAIKVIVN